MSSNWRVVGCEVFVLVHIMSQMLQLSESCGKPQWKAILVLWGGFNPFVKIILCQHVEFASAGGFIILF